MKKRLFFDIETSFNIGFFWRAGKQYIGPDNILEERKIICISWKWEGEDKVYNLTWDENQCDKKMVKKFLKVMRSADEIIAHNGDRFDIRWLKTRALYHRLPALPKYQTLDTLKVVKSHFNFNSNKLDYIAKYLGVGEKMETGGIDLWKKIILDRDQKALEKMVAYCDQDVVVLEKVYAALRNHVGHKRHFGVQNGGEKFCCPECGSNSVRLSKTSTTAAGTIRRHIKCKKCATHYTVSDTTYTKLLEFKVRHGIK